MLLLLLLLLMLLMMLLLMLLFKTRLQHTGSTRLRHEFGRETLNVALQEFELSLEFLARETLSVEGEQAWQRQRREHRAQKVVQRRAKRIGPLL